MNIARRYYPMILTILLVGCATSPNSDSPAQVVPATSTTASRKGSCSLELPQQASNEDAIRAILSAEGKMVVNQDVSSLMNLWTENGQVVDAKNTPDDPGDNQNWVGRDAIRHRYVRTVFPGAPSTAQPADLSIELQDDQAVVRATTQIGSEVSPAGDSWTLVKIDGCWLIQRLTYNLEPLP